MHIFKLKPSFALAAAIACASVATAHDSPIHTHNVWVRATVAQQKVTGAYLQIHTTQKAQLIRASSPASGGVEIHEMRMNDGVMQMQEVKSLDLPAGQTTELKPGGYHLMLIDLKRVLKNDEQVPLQLTIKTADGKTHQVNTQATVRTLNPKDAVPAPHAGHKH